MKPEELFKGLADPTRLRIALLLLDRELCVCDLMAVLQLPQSTVSRHMGRMKSSGLVADRRNGKWVHYRFVDTRSVDELREFLRRHFASTEPFHADRTKLRSFMARGKCVDLPTRRQSRPRKSGQRSRVALPTT